MSVFLFCLLCVFALDIVVTVELCQIYQRRGYAKGQQAVLDDLGWINSKLAVPEPCGLTPCKWEQLRREGRAASVPAGTRRGYPLQAGPPQDMQHPVNTDGPDFTGPGSPFGHRSDCRCETCQDYRKGSGNC